MSHILKITLLALLALLLFLIAPDTAGICKWVDKDGVVHYAETCPEDTNSTEVQIEAPPTPAQIEATSKRMEKIQSETKTRKEQKDLEKRQELLDKQAREEISDSMVRKCAEARWNLTILHKQLPVYYDEANQLHFNRSLHDYWYEGQRVYLDDQQRQLKIEHYTQIESQTCTASEEDIRERIGIYLQKSHRDACMSLRNKLKNMRKSSTGIPSDEMRELEKLINTRCQ